MEIHWIFERDQIPSCYFLDKSNLSANKPNFWIWPKINKYSQKDEKLRLKFLQFLIISQSTSYFNISIQQYNIKISLNGLQICDKWWLKRCCIKVYFTFAKILCRLYFCTMDIGWCAHLISKNNAHASILHKEHWLRACKICHL